MKMSRILSEKVKSKFKNLIREGEALEVHRTMRGKTVPFGCDACISDIELRITDAKESRDLCPRRSDAREHYNGILKVLRRKFRRANRENGGLN